MACSSCAERAKNRVRYEVVTANGEVVYGKTSPVHSKQAAESVAKRYPNSTVREVKPVAKK